MAPPLRQLPASSPSGGWGSGWDQQAVTLIVLTEQAQGFSGLFGYSPFPGAGNLIFSVAAAAGTDPWGNPYPQGLSVTTGSISGLDILGALISGGQISGAVFNVEGPDGGLFVYSGTPGPLNANAYFVQGVDPWTGGNGATVAPSALFTYNGSPHSMQITPDGVTASPQALSEVITAGVTGGQVYGFTAQVTISAGWAPGVQLVVNWFTAGGVFISSSFTGAVPVPASTSPTQLVLGNITAPGGAGRAELFVKYAGTPPAAAAAYVGLAAFGMYGTLQSSITGMSGFDQFGNPVVAGDASYSATNFSQLLAGALTIGSLAGSGSADLIWGSASALAAGSMARLIADDPTGTQAFVDLLAPAGATPGAVYLYGFNPSTGAIVPISAGLSGDLAYVLPGVSPAPEVWNPLSLAAGWTTGAAGLAAQYQRLAAPPRTVELIGQIANSGGVSGTVSPFTTVLPAGYRPNHDQRWQLQNVNATGAVAYPLPNIHVSSAGAITLENLPAGTTQVQFHCYISLNA